MGVSGQRAARLLREVQKPILEQTPPPIVEVDCRVPGDRVLRSRPVPSVRPRVYLLRHATVTRSRPTRAVRESTNPAHPNRPGEHTRSGHKAEHQGQRLGIGPKEQARRRGKGRETRRPAGCSLHAVSRSVVHSIASTVYGVNATLPCGGAKRLRDRQDATGTSYRAR
jgi:hypothetical protein